VSALLTDEEINAAAFAQTKNHAGHFMLGAEFAREAREGSAAPVLAEALAAIIGTAPDKYGYRAAGNAMDDDKRQAAREALALAGVDAHGERIGVNAIGAAEDFGYGARFARAIYEARLAEDAKARAGLVATLQNLVSAICKVQDWDGTRVGFALDDVDAALAAAKEIE